MVNRFLERVKSRDLGHIRKRKVTNDVICPRSESSGCIALGREGALECVKSRDFVGDLRQKIIKIRCQIIKLRLNTICTIAINHTTQETITELLCPAACYISYSDPRN
jgi:hypothetical protein